MSENPTTTKILGKQVLDELGLRGQLYAIFDKSEKETLSAIETRRELRAFFDQIGLECVSALGTPGKLIEALQQQRSVWTHPVNASAGEWDSVPLSFYIWIFGTYCASTILINWLVRPNASLVGGLASGVGVLAGGCIVALTKFGVDRHRAHKRQKRVAEVRATEAHLYSAPEAEFANQPLVAELSQ